MTAYPAPAAILDAVTRFLRDELLPTIDGREAFQLRVSINAIDLVAREIAHGAHAHAITADGIASLLGERVENATPQALCEAIEQDDPGLDPDALLEHLRRATIARLAIDQPGYSAFRAAAEAGERPW